LIFELPEDGFHELVSFLILEFFDIEKPARPEQEVFIVSTHIVDGSDLLADLLESFLGHTDINVWELNWQEVEGSLCDRQHDGLRLRYQNSL
jgi:hypothetical protein